MATARDNDPQELERFKQRIDLVDYAQRQGYQLTKESRRGDWHHLEREGEKLIVTQKRDHQVYLNTGDDRDRGSIIDFVKTRGGEGGRELNLGQVRQQLRTYLNEEPAPTRLYPVVQPAPAQAGEAEEARRTQMIAEVLGINKELTDRTYLHSRGISDATLDNAAFQGRVFTAQQNEYRNTAFPLYNDKGLVNVEQKNHDFKNLLPVPKDGIWVSHPTEGKGTVVERVVISESGVDSLSYHQLKHEQDRKNTLYVATSGTPTQAQIALIQRVIDKQDPREVVLANDRDVGGRQFTINYLNDLQPARQFRALNGQEAYAEASRPVEWHATSSKYHVGLKVTYYHDGHDQGAERTQPLLAHAERINAAEGTRSIHVEVQRSSERETVLRLSVARSDVAQLEVLSHELCRQRERLRPEQERQREPFIRVDYPQSKDWNQDLQLTQPQLRAEQEKLRGTEKQVIIKVEEPAVPANARSQAAAVKDAIAASGARVGDLHTTTDDRGIQHTELRVAYRTDQPNISRISQTLDAIGKQPGNEVVERSDDRTERRAVSSKQLDVSRTSPAEVER